MPIVLCESVINLVLPYPTSANRYWRPVKVGKHVAIVPTKEAKAYRQAVGWQARAAGVKLITGRVSVEIELYPHRPQDWQKRQRERGDAWDDTVQCLDLDNANKVLLDALKGVAFDDDKWVRSLSSRRMEPDAKGARVVVSIAPVAYVQPQIGLELPAPPDLAREAALAF
jgi:crossover junction endodeoxyribonuclease RusA